MPEIKGWMIEISIILIAALVISFIVDSSLRHFEKKLSHNKTIWDDLILWSIRTPLKILIWSIGIILAIRVIASRIGIDIIDEISLSKNLIIITCLSWFAWRMVKKYENYLSKIHDKKIVGSINTLIITRSLKAVIVVISLLMIMQTIGISISGLVAFGGIGGIAIGFAAKDLLANFFGTIMIYFDRPFCAGDKISSPDRKIEGIVENIGWRLTHVRTSNQSTIYIPNSIFSTIIVETIKNGESTQT